MGFARRATAAVKRTSWLRSVDYGVRKSPSNLLGVPRERLFFGYMWQALSGVDLPGVASSDQMIDFVGGAWEFPYTHCRWALLAGLRGVRVAFMSVGAGPLDGWLARFLVRTALSRAAHVSVRDQGSREIVCDLGFKGDIEVSPDLAFSLLWIARVPCGAKVGAGVVVINPMPVFDARYWPTADADRYRRYLDALAELSAAIVATGKRVVLFGTRAAREWAADDVLVRLSSDVQASGRIELARPRTLEQLLELLSHSDFVVATRFHGILLSLLVGTPVVRVCYYGISRD